jgi:hypothetical protein
MKVDYVTNGSGRELPICVKGVDKSDMFRQ